MAMAMVMELKYDYSGKVALITGSSSGIGYEIARQFLLYGCNVVLNGRSDVRLSVAARRMGARDNSTTNARVECVAGDVRDWLQALNVVNSAVTRFGRLDIVVNNAGGNFHCPLSELSPNGWHATLNANLTSVFLVSKASFPHLTSRGGVIVNIGSIAAFGAHPGRGTYGAAKAAVHSLTATMAYEWIRYGIRVVCIAPGATDNDDRRWTDSSVRNDVLSRIPAGRLGTPMDVARVCLFVCSSEAEYITGTTIRVDGGPKLAV